MDARKIIPIEVKDEYILGAGRSIGAKGSHDDVALRVTFNDMWSGMAKTAVWCNALGEQPVVLTLTSLYWEGSDPSVMLIPIPEEAKSEAGNAMLTIKGFASSDGVTETTATLTATAYFRVLDSDFSQDASDSGSITLNQSEQFLSTLSAMEEDIAAAAKAADAKEAAEAARSAAEAAQSGAEDSAQSAAEDALRAKEQAELAAQSEDAAERDREAAEKAKLAAEAAQGGAEQAAESAGAAQENAETAAATADSKATEAAQNATNAETSALSAAKSESAAAQSASRAASEASRAASSNEDIVDMIDGFGDTVTDAENRVNALLGGIDEHLETARSYSESAWEAAEAAEAAAEEAESAAVASKEYVDEELSKKLDKTGGTVTGDVLAYNASVKSVSLYGSETALNPANITVTDESGKATLSTEGLFFEDALGNKKTVGGIGYATEDDQAVPFAQMEEYVAENGGGVSQEYVDTELSKKLDKTGGTLTGDLTFDGGTIKGLTTKSITDAEEDEAVSWGSMDGELDYYHSLRAGKELPSDANFNDYKTLGTFAFVGDTASLKNAPAEISSPFKLNVFLVGNANTRVQEIFEAKTGVRYYRRGTGLFSVTWSDWAIEGGGGVSSWNDLTDKPFYSEWVEILGETTVEIDSESGQGALPDVVDVIVGNTYTVKWNGVEYICFAQSYDMDGVPVTVLGNLDAVTGGEPTEEPFVLVFLDAETAAAMGVGCMCVALDGSASVTLSIICEVVHKLNEKYLPNANAILYINGTLTDRNLYVDKELSRRPTSSYLKSLVFGAKKVFICLASTIDNTEVFQYFDVKEYRDAATVGAVLIDLVDQPYYTAEYTG